jgi:hypothetical protein
MRGVATLRIKQYGEYWLSAINDSGVLRLSALNNTGSIQYGEYRLSAINDSGESIENRQHLFEFEAKFGKPSVTE